MIISYFAEQRQTIWPVFVRRRRVPLHFADTLDEVSGFSDTKYFLCNRHENSLGKNLEAKVALNPWPVTAQLITQELNKTVPFNSLPLYTPQLRFRRIQQRRVSLLLLPLDEMLVIGDDLPKQLPLFNKLLRTRSYFGKMLLRKLFEKLTYWKTKVNVKRLIQ